MKLVQILGTGCAGREKLKKNDGQTVAELEIATEQEEFTDNGKMTGFDAMMAAVLARDGEVEVASADVLKTLLH